MHRLLFIAAAWPLLDYMLGDDGFAILINQRSHSTAVARLNKQIVHASFGVYNNGCAFKHTF